MLEWCIPVIRTSASADTQGSLPVKPNDKMGNDIYDKDAVRKVITTLYIAMSLFGVAKERN
eukprot:2792349-Ditylum_brightwellii.AAC.1